MTAVLTPHGLRFRVEGNPHGPRYSLDSALWLATFVDKLITPKPVPAFVHIPPPPPAREYTVTVIDFAPRPQPSPGYHLAAKGIYQGSAYNWFRFEQDGGAA